MGSAAKKKRPMRSRRSGVKKMELVDTVFTKTVLNSGLLNLTFDINENNKIKFKNIRKINGNSR